MQIITRVTPAFIAAITLAVSAGEAAAQYYSAEPYSRGTYGSRAPAPADDDYPPGVYRAPAGRDGYQRAGDRVDRQALPPPDATGSLARPSYGSPSPNGAPGYAAPPSTYATPAPGNGTQPYGAPPPS